MNGLNRFISYAKSELGGNTNGPHHPERIIAKRLLTIHRGFYNSFFQIFNTSERIVQNAELIRIEAPGEGVDREVAPELIIFQGAIFHQGFTGVPPVDRKSTRLNSSHVAISYAVFCLEKKKTI